MAKNAPFNKIQTSEELAYLAGIIDGEGCFYIGHIKQANKTRPQQFHILISIANNELILMEWLDKITGRKHDGRYRYQSKRKNEKPTYRCTISGNLLDYLLPKIHKYLVIKKKHCEIFIEIRKTFYNRGSKPLSDEEVDYRLTLMRKVRVLNSRFHGHPLKN